jgi:hypothetical protein
MTQGQQWHGRCSYDRHGRDDSKSKVARKAFHISSQSSPNFDHDHKENRTVRNKIGIVLALVFVLSFGSLVFAQSSNSSTTTATTNTNTSTSTTHRGRRSHRRARRRSRRHARHSSRKAGGNSNMSGGNMSGGNANR